MNEKVEGEGINSYGAQIICHILCKFISNPQSNLQRFLFPFPFLGWTNKDPGKLSDLAKDTQLISSSDSTQTQVCPMIDLVTPGFLHFTAQISFQFFETSMLLPSSGLLQMLFCISYLLLPNKLSQGLVA